MFVMSVGPFSSMNSIFRVHEIFCSINKYTFKSNTTSKETSLLLRKIICKFTLVRHGSR